MTGRAEPRVSLVATVLNEAESIHDWMAGIDAQCRAPDEIIVVDGGSIDGTRAALESWCPRVRKVVIDAPGSTIAAGRNAGIDAATGEIVAVTDAGTRASADWLERLVATLVSSGADVASGFFVPDVRSAWDAALAAATLPRVNEVSSSTFLPSSRSVAFRRSWFEIGCAYPEWLDYCEDLVFDLILRRAGARFVFEPNAIVTYRVRPNLTAFWRQYYRYARGDGKAGLYPRRHAIRYSVYLGAALVVLRRRPHEVLAAAVLAALYLRRPFMRLPATLRACAESGTPDEPGSGKQRQRELGRATVAAAWIPIIRLVGDIAKMCGYPAGIVWRVRTYGGVGPAFTWRRIAPRSGVRRL